MRFCFVLWLLLTVAAITQTSAQSFHSAKGSAPDAGSIFIYPERIPLEAGGFLHAERGMLFVPLNRSNPDSDVIGIEIYRFRRSESATPDAPPVFFLHGGPGFGGLESSLGEPGTFEERWQAFTDVSDLVVISQRGIGPSRPTTLIETTFEPQDLSKPNEETEMIAVFREMLAREREAWEVLGLDLNGFTVLEAAADIDDVRKVLGYDKITIWGGSFGSHWGMAYMRMYGQNVERAILRGMEGPDHTYDHPGHLWNVYERVAEEAENSDLLKEEIPEGGLVNAIAEVIRRVDEKPFEVQMGTNKVLIDGQVIRQLSRGYSGGLQAWPADVITMYRGNFDPAAARMVMRNRESGRNYRTASYWMLDCGSGITSGRLFEHDIDPAMDILGRWNWWYKNGCTEWDSDLGDGFRQNFYTDIPTVIVHGTWDTSTPYENALELVPYFRNSKFIPVLRGPHGAIRAAFRESAEFKSALFKFAATGDMSDLPDSVEIREPKWTKPD